MKSVSQFNVLGKMTLKMKTDINDGNIQQEPWYKIRFIKTWFSHEEQISNFHSGGIRFWDKPSRDKRPS